METDVLIDELVPCRKWVESPEKDHHFLCYSTALRGSERGVQFEFPSTATYSRVQYSPLYNKSVHRE